MELWQLQQAQELPLELKIIKSQQRIREWYEHWRGDVYVSFSGGKDSTVHCCVSPMAELYRCRRCSKIHDRGEIQVWVDPKIEAPAQGRLFE